VSVLLILLYLVCSVPGPSLERKTSAGLSLHFVCCKLRVSTIVVDCLLWKDLPYSVSRVTLNFAH